MMNRMKRVPSMLVLAALLAAGTVAACRYPRFGVLVNRSDTPITVSYVAAIPPRAGDDAPPSRCPLEPGQIRIEPNMGSVERWSAGSTTVAVDYTIDEASCAIEFVLPSRSGAVLFRDHFCAKDREALAANGERRGYPYFEVLRITSGTVTESWTRWDAIERFHRQQSGHCFLVFPSGARR